MIRNRTVWILTILLLLASQIPTYASIDYPPPWSDAFDGISVIAVHVEVQNVPPHSYSSSEELLAREIEDMVFVELKNKLPTEIKAYKPDGLNVMLYTVLTEGGNAEEQGDISPEFCALYTRIGRIRVEIDCSDYQTSSYFGHIRLTFFRSARVFTSWEESSTFGMDSPVWDILYTFVGNQDFGAYVNTTVHKSLTSFIADFYEGRPDL